MPQSKEELDDWYTTQDPWTYASNPDDLRRKNLIISVASVYGPFARALDIGAGEGFITTDLPAIEKNGYELSDVAASRFPTSVFRKVSGVYSLVVATGVLYRQYDWISMASMIGKHAGRIVLTCNIKDWELPEAIAMIPGRQILDAEFPYREYIQKLRVFDVSAS